MGRGEQLLHHHRLRPRLWPGQDHLSPHPLSLLGGARVVVGEGLCPGLPMHTVQFDEFCDQSSNMIFLYFNQLK